MEEDDPSSVLDHRAQLLQALISPLSFSTSKLSNKSRTIPHDRDFHFYNNFQEFKLPAKEISSKAQSSLQSLSSSTNLFGSKSQPPMPSDLDDSYDWLVNLNDEFIERFNLSLDEFKNSREKEESKSVNLQLQEGGFQLVNNRKKKGCSMNEVKKDVGIQSTRVLKEKAAGLKSRVPFHIPTIPRPQDEFNILVNNVNKPFEHVWLERSEDGSCVIHPLEKLSIMDFTDRRIQEDEIVKPLPLESTPFKLVEGVKELKALAAKLMDANEFAVDLEHNQYRSFQGLTCLMQISTRTEDFIVDTLKLRVHIGPYLREVFKDPSKRKVMHGADRDIEWLQRDFGIYICNLFDTGQASRVMQLERNSLEYLLLHFCGVHANKEYQNADWRLRPLPDEMIKYAREDTHYLLHIYDLMRRMLLSASSDENDLLLEVYRRSYDVCIHLYQRELLTDNSFLHIYGLQDADFNSKQLAVADGLYQWRDRVAREEDESTGYILPNKALLEIAKQMPVSSGKLRRLVKSKNSVIERHLNTLTKTIRCQIEKSAKYESIAKQLQKARLEQAEEAGNDSEMVLDSDDPTESSSQKDTLDVAGSAEIVEASTNVVDDHANPKNFSSQISLDKCQQNTESMLLDSGCSSKVGDTMTIIEEQKIDNGKLGLSLPDKKAGVASVQIMKKQTCSFGALLGSSASRRKLNPTNGFLREQEKNANKVEQIKSSVTLPFHSFSGRDSHSEPILSEINKQAQQEMSSSVQHSAAEQPVSAAFEEVIQLENNESDGTQSPGESLSADSPKRSSEGAAEELASLADLSSSFQQCFQSISQTTKSSSLTNKKKKNNNKQSQEPEANIEVKPFDYASARKNVNFGGAREGDGLRVGDKARLDSREKQRGSTAGRADEQDRERGLRRQAFPASGNRSTSYK